MVTTLAPITLDDYIHYTNNTDTRYELVNGELSPMSIGTGQHGEIIDYLNRQLRLEIERLQQDLIVKPMVIGLQSPRSHQWYTVRIPDLFILPRHQWRELHSREAVIRAGEPAPLLVIEVVSETTRSTDYRTKRSEYSVLNIPEYWIVDPLDCQISILTLSDGWYDATKFVGDTIIESPMFPELHLTVSDVMQGDW